MSEVDLFKVQVGDVLIFRSGRAVTVLDVGIYIKECNFPVFLEVKEANHESEFMNFKQDGSWLTNHQDLQDVVQVIKNISTPVEPTDELPELIVCAANRDPETERTYLCVRHGCDMFWQQIDAESPPCGETGEGKDCNDFEQGFYTNKNRFVSREEAFLIAKENNQIKRSCPTKSQRLYSEMLY